MAIWNAFVASTPQPPWYGRPYNFLSTTTERLLLSRSGSATRRRLRSSGRARRARLRCVSSGRGCLLCPQRCGHVGAIDSRDPAVRERLSKRQGLLRPVPLGKLTKQMKPVSSRKTPSHWRFHGTPHSNFPHLGTEDGGWCRTFEIWMRPRPSVMAQPRVPALCSVPLEDSGINEYRGGAAVPAVVSNAAVT